MSPVHLRYYLDPNSGLPHIYGHDVSEDEVGEALAHRLEDVAGRRGSRIAVGQTESGRYLQVIYSPDEGRDSLFLITAYELTGRRLQAFKRRQRRRRQ